MKRSLASQGIEKVYQVRQYTEFPFKKEYDPIMKEYDKIKEARQGAKYFERRTLNNNRYYVMDNPHDHKEATEQQETKWDKALVSCGLR
jgi:hypothetical protein